MLLAEVPPPPPPPPPPKVNAPPAAPVVAPKLKPPVLLGDTAGAPLPAAVDEPPPKLKGWLAAEALPAAGAVAVPAAATGAGAAKLKLLGELAPAASGLPPKVKGAPLGGATSGEGAVAAAPNENNPFPVASEAAVEGGGV